MCIDEKCPADVSATFVRTPYVSCWPASFIVQGCYRIGICENSCPKSSYRSEDTARVLAWWCAICRTFDLLLWDTAEKKRKRLRALSRHAAFRPGNRRHACSLVPTKVPSPWAVAFSFQQDQDQQRMPTLTRRRRGQPPRWERRVLRRSMPRR